MLSESTLDAGGNRRRTTMKVTQETEMTPMGKYHRPREKLPGTKVLRPDVMRRKMGVT